MPIGARRPYPACTRSSSFSPPQMPYSWWLRPYQRHSCWTGHAAQISLARASRASLEWGRSQTEERTDQAGLCRRLGRPVVFPGHPSGTVRRRAVATAVTSAMAPPRRSDALFWSLVVPASRTGLNGLGGRRWRRSEFRQRPVARSKLQPCIAAEDTVGHSSELGEVGVIVRTPALHDPAVELDLIHRLVRGPPLVVSVGPASLAAPCARATAT